MYKIDLNCDLGESFGRYTLGLDGEVIPLITSANIACGYHASDPVIMEKTVKLAKDNGVHIGAHTGFPDLMGFGRRNMVLTMQEARTYTIYQIGALKAFCDASGTKLSHIKPHGAFYNMAAKDYDLAHAICEGVHQCCNELIFLGLSGSIMEKAALDTGLIFKSEVFADRAYEEDGSLVARSKPGAMIEDEAAIPRVIRMITEGKVKAITGRDIDIKADSVCVHGDGPKTLEFIKLLREACNTSDIKIEVMS